MLVHLQVERAYLARDNNINVAVASRNLLLALECSHAKSRKKDKKVTFTGKCKLIPIDPLLHQLYPVKKADT